MNIHLLTNLQLAEQGKRTEQTGKNVRLFYKRTLSNEMEIFDFEEDLVIDQMEKMMTSLDNLL